MKENEDDTSDDFGVWSRNIDDLKRRLGNIVIGYTKRYEVMARDWHEGAMAGFFMMLFYLIWYKPLKVTCYYTWWSFC